jgi:hypothetical protein
MKKVRLPPLFDDHFKARRADQIAIGRDVDDRLVRIAIQRWFGRICDDPIIQRDEELRSFVESDFGVSKAKSACYRSASSKTWSFPLVSISPLYLETKCDRDRPRRHRPALSRPSPKSSVKDLQTKTRIYKLPRASLSV